MFSKEQKSRYEPTEPPAEQSWGRPADSSKAAPSIISPDLKVTGNLESRGDVQIDGCVEGDVNCQSLTIGETADVTGTVQSQRVRVCGKVQGEVKADAVVLAKSAHVSGDIAHKSLEIEAGAQFEGSVRKLDSAPALVKPEQPAKVESKPKPAKNGSAGSISTRPSDAA